MFVRRFASAVVACALVGGMLGAVSATAATALPDIPQGVSTSTAGGDFALTWSRLPGASAYHLQIASEVGTPTLVKDVTTYAPVYVVPDAIDSNQSRDLYWRVAAYGTGTTSSTQGQYTEWQVLSRGALAAPASLSPGSTDLDNPGTVAHPAAVTFTWGSVPGAAQYTLQYSSDPGFAPNVTTTQTTTATSYTPTVSLARSPVQWYWRVRADYYTGTTGSFAVGALSTPRSFVITWTQKPTLIYPTEVTADFYSDVRFSWSPVVGAASYTLELASDAAFNTIVQTQTLIYGTTWVPTTTLLNTDYYWRVTPVDASGQAGTRSTARQFTKGWGRQTAATGTKTDQVNGLLPPPIYPQPHQGTTDPEAPEEIPFDQFELSWDPVARSTFYEVVLRQVGGPKVFSCHTASTSVTIISSVTPGANSPGKLDDADICLWNSPAIAVGETYQWSVQAVDLTGASATSIRSPIGSALVTEPSDPMSDAAPGRARYIKIVPPVGSAGAAIHVDETAFAQETATELKGQPAPLFSWSPVSGALSYQVEVALDNSFTNKVALVCTPTTRMRMNGVFDDTTTDTQPYFWRVRAVTSGVCNVTYTTGPWSAEQPYWRKASKPTGFAGVDPVTTLPDGSQLLAWQPQAQTAPLDGGSRGYQITIKDSGGNVVGSPTKVEYPYFAVQNPSTKRPLARGVGYTFTVAPLDANGSAGTPSAEQGFDVSVPGPSGLTATARSSSAVLAWTPAAVTSTYKVEYKLQGAPSYTSISTPQAGVTIAELPPGTYDWRVTSLDAASNLSTTVVGASFVIGAGAPAQVTTAGVALNTATARLSWNSVAGASRYLVRIATSELGLGAATMTVETSATSYVPTQALSFGQPYYWNVSALPEKATTSSTRTLLGTSAARAFTVVTPPGAISLQTATAVGTTVNLTWLALSSAQKGSALPLTYDVRYRALAVDGVENDWHVAAGVPDSLSYSASGLPDSSTFEIQLRAKTELGAGPWSPSKTFTTASAPGVVRGLVATPSASGILVTWMAPSSNGGSAITGYVVSYRRAIASPWTTINPTSTSATLTGLSGGVGYEIMVQAKNAVGIGVAANATATMVAAPSAPTGVTAVRGEASGKISWKAPSNVGGTAVTGYTVQVRYYTTVWSAWSTVVNPSASTLTATVTGLTNGRKYEARVLAKNSVGTGDASASVGFIPASKPNAPTSVKTTSMTKKVKISWSKPATNGSTISGYVVAYSKDRKTWTKIKTITSASTLSYTWTAPKTKVAYFFRVNATSNLGSSAVSSSVIGFAK